LKPVVKKEKRRTQSTENSIIKKKSVPFSLIKKKKFKKRK